MDPWVEHSLYLIRKMMRISRLVHYVTDFCVPPICQKLIIWQCCKHANSGEYLVIKNLDCEIVRYNVFVFYFVATTYSCVLITCQELTPWYNYFM